MKGLLIRKTCLILQIKRLKEKLVEKLRFFARLKRGNKCKPRIENKGHSGDVVG